MSTVDQTPESYRDALLRDMPRGKFWRRDDGSRLAGLLEGIGAELARVYNRICDLLEESDPRTASETLDQWEITWGLPDPCVATPPTTDADRREALTAKVIETGGQNAAYYIEVAAALGITITITEGFSDSPLFRAGVSRAGHSLGDFAEGPFTWTVHGPAATTAGKRDQLECTFDRIRPAHTIVLFDWTV